MSSTPPKKYVKINGVMKLNPEYKKWKESQDGGGSGTTPFVPNADQALPVVTNMQDHEQLNEVVVASGGQEVPLSESTNATIEMMQEPEISFGAGMQPDAMVDELGKILNKYEVPMGLMNKLMMISEFDSLEFIIDDSGSMSLNTDSVDPKTGRPLTRWMEAEQRLKEMVEILAHVPFQKVVVCFLNRRDQVIIVRNQRPPQAVLQEATTQIDRVFRTGPVGSTPAYEKIKESFDRGAGKSIARYFFGDGVPNGGVSAQRQITSLLRNRQNPSTNPMTFISCSNEDDQVEWMKDAEEVAPYCSESDDYKDEAAEVMRDQGAALPYTKGFYLVGQLVAAMNPDDLDAMDESVPFTKATLDNLLGIQHNIETYKHYFDCFRKAQRERVVGRDDGTGRPNRADQLKKDVDWDRHFQEFVSSPVANQIPAVQNFKNQLKQLEGGP